MPDSGRILGLTARVREEIHTHVFGNPDREVGGVLVGARLIDDAVRVTGSIAALEAVGERAAVTFTHDAWELVHRELDRRFPDQQIVGWYHSHPGFGIFLSRDDLFIHESFFSEPWQFAYVIDPIGLEEGEFGWRGGEVVEVDHRSIDAPRGFRPPPKPRQSVTPEIEPEPTPDALPVPPPPLQPWEAPGQEAPVRVHRAGAFPWAAAAAGLAIGALFGILVAPVLGIGDSDDGSGTARRAPARQVQSESPPALAPAPKMPASVTTRPSYGVPHRVVTPAPAPARPPISRENVEQEKLENSAPETVPSEPAPLEPASPAPSGGEAPVAESGGGVGGGAALPPSRGSDE